LWKVIHPRVPSLAPNGIRATCDIEWLKSTTIRMKAFHVTEKGVKC
jgi:hypothetical protein